MTKIPGVIVNLKQARKHARAVAKNTGKPVLIFPVPEGTAAWQLGYRFGYCEASERKAYARDGATFIETVKP